MARTRGRRRANDPSSGGKRAAMTPAGFADSPTEYQPEDPAESAGAASSLVHGTAVIQKKLRSLPGAPGVYRMIDRRGDVLYVGKAQNLKKRVTSYTQANKLSIRLQRMVAQTKRLEVVRTHTEIEALLLESNLIKRFKPRYNVLLRDDKSFPYILLPKDHPYPQIIKHRGAHKREGDYYGPFASAGAVNRTITALERGFLLRSCSDAVFAGRTRPCLMYQIKRCSAPCVGRITKDDYNQLVEQTRSFLSGDSQDIPRKLAAEMQQASDQLDFETAAVLRDRVRAMAHIRSRQDINVEGVDDADVIAAHQDAGQTCIQVFFFRAGRNYGNRAYFPSHSKDMDVAPVLSAFVAQFYDDKPTPKLVLLSHGLEDQSLVTDALSLRAGRRIRVLCPKRGDKRQLIENALNNARQALALRLSESSSQRRLLEEVAKCFDLDATPERIEVYDNSHIQGDSAYGAMIVAGQEGFRKSAYRKFSIKGARPSSAAPGEGYTPRDDTAMMREVLSRRFSRALKEDPERDSGQWPDLVLLDGGRGQLNAALEVLADLGLEDLNVAAIAKGPDRNAGRERIFRPGTQPILLAPRDPLLYYLQRLRDEAHRFAIGSHRKGRSNTRLKSILDEVEGIGSKRKRALLLHFGSAQAVRQAGLSDLESVSGISKTVAQKIYEHFH